MRRNGTSGLTTSKAIIISLNWPMTATKAAWPVIRWLSMASPLPDREPAAWTAALWGVRCLASAKCMAWVLLWKKIWTTAMPIVLP